MSAGQTVVVAFTVGVVGLVAGFVAGYVRRRNQTRQREQVDFAFWEGEMLTHHRHEREDDEHTRSLLDDLFGDSRDVFDGGEDDA